jgi:hypothetical protein
VSLLNSIDRPHVLTAIETWDKAGGSNYMLVRGGVSTHVLVHGGREYDATAIVGIAHGLATGNTLTPAEVPGGGAGASKALTRLGFDIRDDSPPAPQRVPGTRSTTPRTPRATTTRATTPRPRVAASDRVDKLCPTCFLALPATGICDNCA